MTFRCEDSVTNGIRVLTLHGYVDKPAGKVLLQRIGQRIDAGERRLVIDFSDAPLMCSTALGDLIDALSQQLSVPDLRFALCGVSPTLLTCFTSVGLLDFATVTGTRGEALTAIAT